MNIFNKNILFCILLYKDEEVPQLQCPEDVTVDTAETEPTAVATWNEPEVTDNSGDNVIVTMDPSPDSVFAIGITNVTVLAIDTSDNVASCIFNVIVEGKPKKKM